MVSFEWQSVSLSKKAVSSGSFGKTLDKTLDETFGETLSETLSETLGETLCETRGSNMQSIGRALQRDSDDSHRKCSKCSL